MFKQLKDRALQGAMKIMQSDQAQRVISSPEVQKAMMKAVQTGFKVKEDIDNTRKVLAKRLNIATGDDLANLKRKLDRLERRVSDLREENEHLRAQQQNGTDDNPDTTAQADDSDA